MISWKKRDSNTITFFIDGKEGKNQVRFHNRSIKHPDLMVEILQKMTELNSYEQECIRDYSYALEDLGLCKSRE